MSEIAGLRYRCPAYMSNKKIIFFCSLAVALSALIFLSVYFLKIKRFVNVPLNPSTVIATSTQESIDTSNRRIYRNANVGLELIVPVDSGETKTLLANDVSDVYHHPFWYSLFGVHYFASKNSDIMFVSVTTTSTIDFLADRFALNPQEDVAMNGYQGRAEVSSEFVPTFTEDVPGNYTMTDRLILKNGEKMYFFEAHFYAENESEVKELYGTWRLHLNLIKLF